MRSRITNAAAHPDHIVTITWSDGAHRGRPHRSDSGLRTPTGKPGDACAGTEFNKAFNTEAEREPRRTTESAVFPPLIGRHALSVVLRGSRSASVLKAFLVAARHGFALLTQTRLQPPDKTGKRATSHVQILRNRNIQTRRR